MVCKNTEGIRVKHELGNKRLGIGEVHGDFAEQVNKASVVLVQTIPREGTVMIHKNHTSILLCRVLRSECLPPK